MSSTVYWDFLFDWIPADGLSLQEDCLEEQTMKSRTIGTPTSRGSFWAGDSTPRLTNPSVKLKLIIDHSTPLNQEPQSGFQTMLSHHHPSTTRSWTLAMIQQIPPRSPTQVVRPQRRSSSTRTSIWSSPLVSPWFNLHVNPSLRMPTSTPADVENWAAVQVRRPLDYQQQQRPLMWLLRLCSPETFVCAAI